MQAQLQVQQAATAKPTISERDAVALMSIVWDYQEVRRLGWVTIHRLQEESGLGWPRFTQALDLLLECPRIVQTKAGGLAYTW